jgi:hypothetical protein
MVGNGRANHGLTIVHIKRHLVIETYQKCTVKAEAGLDEEFR